MFTKKTQTAYRRSPQRAARRSRKGAAVVEAALCIPVIVILMLGTVEVSSRFYLKESLTIAAYEGARTGAKRRATNAQVIQRVEDILAARNVDLGASGTITVTPNDLTTLNALDPLTVTVTCPPAGNCSMVFDGIVATSNMTATVKIAREFDH
jgi:Flp pilus assembly protein TadG